MQSMARTPRHGDGHLWMIAFGLSLLANAGILASVGFAALESAKLRARIRPPVTPPAPSVAMIFPDMGDAPKASATHSGTPAAPPPVELAGSRFARTSADQSASRPDNPLFLGERNTRATSDRAPDPNAPPLPSQAGINPRDDMHLETTESDYQEGPLDSAEVAAAAASPPAPAAPAPEEPAPAMAAAAKEDSSDPSEADAVSSIPPPREPVLDGPLAVDVPVPREVAGKRATESPPEARHPTDPAPPKTAGLPKTTQDPKPTPPKNPGFRGYQRKTAVVGSISRTGRSALDVEDSPLGRYQAALSRAVELEWQRNCVRHRDFITPGFLTVRFFVEPGGKVRSVQFVGDMSTGEIQKGFTLNSIRDAAIPPMPADVRKEFTKEPLELIFRFYF
jgi:hypothetical protein